MLTHKPIRSALLGMTTMFALAAVWVGGCDAAGEHKNVSPAAVRHGSMLRYDVASELRKLGLGNEGPDAVTAYAP